MYRLAAWFAVPVVVGSLLAKHFGWYHDYWYTDVILHTLSGLSLGFLWFGLMKKSSFSPKWFGYAGAVMFATFVSTLWEFYEFAGYSWFPSVWPNYFLLVSDTLGDISCGLLGGAIAAVIYFFI